MTNLRWQASRPGRFTVIDLIVVILLVTAVSLVVLMALPRAREHARLAGCQQHLAHLGKALALFDEITGRLPGVEPPRGLDQSDGPPSPPRQIYDLLKIPDLAALDDPSGPPQPNPTRVPGEQFVPGLVCPSDRHAGRDFHPAPSSYRACTGSDPAGSNGVFAPGAIRRLAAIQHSDGLSYKAAYSERLVGTGGDRPDPTSYQVVPDDDGWKRPAPVQGVWHNDAGARWTIADYRHTLYNHAALPDTQPSLITHNGRKARISASSGHTVGVNVLFGDGRVEPVRRTIDPGVWRRLAELSFDPEPDNP